MLSVFASRRPGRRRKRFAPGQEFGRENHLEQRSLAAPILLRAPGFLGVKAWINLEPTTWVSTPGVAYQIANTTVQAQYPFTGATVTAQGTSETVISDGNAASTGSPGVTVSTTHDHQESLQGDWLAVPAPSTITTQARGTAVYNIVDDQTGLPTTYDATGHFEVVFAPSPDPVDEAIFLRFNAPGVYAGINNPGDPDSSNNNLHLVYMTPSGPVNTIYPNFGLNGGDVLITFSYTDNAAAVAIGYQSSMTTIARPPGWPTQSGYASQELFWYEYDLEISP
jgi:hypothetical protein